MKVEEAPRPDSRSKRTVRLLKMGAFVRAYDWSAWLLKRYGSPLNEENGYVIAPDNFKGEIAHSYANDAGLATAGDLVFLPAAYLRNGSNVNNLLNHYYWSSTAYGSNFAYCVYFDSDDVFPDLNFYRISGYSVHLVTESN